MIEREDTHGITTLRFAHGKVSALDLEFLQALDASLAACEASRAIVLTGTGSSFSAGVDLFRLVRDGVPYVDRFVPLLSAVFRRLFAFPRPVVAAVNGHAIAGGCIITCAADWRFMAAGTARIGVPELRVGVPFPVIALEIVRFATGGRGIQEIALGGANYVPEEALARGLIDAIVPPGDVLQRAQAQAESLASVPPQAFALAKKELRGPTLELADRLTPDHDARVLAEWRKPETHAAIRAHLEKTVGKRS